jgi:transposase
LAKPASASTAGGSWTCPASVATFPTFRRDSSVDRDATLAKGYDSELVRQDIEQRGGQAMIPSIANRKVQHTDKALYTLRNRIERFFNHARIHVGSRPAAKLIESFAAFVLLACIRIWIRFCPHDLKPTNGLRIR